MSTYEELRKAADAVWAEVEKPPKTRVAVSVNTSSIVDGARETIEALRREIELRGLDAEVGIVGDTGFSFAEPVVQVTKPDGSRVMYGNVTADRAVDFVHDALQRDGICRHLAIAVAEGPAVDGVPMLYDYPFWAIQTRRVMVNCGVIDPENIDHYIARSGYEAAARALSMAPEEITKELTEAMLSGCGGAYFSTGRKWEFLRTANRTPKYLVCNADEGDAGSFVNRVLLESDPHLILEGMLIGAIATGAEHGIIYLRVEYPLALERLNVAISQARAKGILGESVMGSDVKFDIEVVRGAGSYVCGDETGLISSVDDDRGMPRIKPPFPAQAGVFGQPTNVNNVETYAHAAQIMCNGPAWFKETGCAENCGTKMFSVSGHVEKVGVLEVPFGTPVRTMLMACGGVPDGKALKAIQSGGPLGGLLPAAYVDLALDPHAFLPTTMGSGGFVFIDDSACIIDICIAFGEFNEDESCGRCTTCRIGTQRILEIARRIADGRGREDDYDLIRTLGKTMIYSNCGHGQLAASIILNSIDYFQDEFRQHIAGKHCSAGSCRGLTHYEVTNPDDPAVSEAAAICPTEAIVKRNEAWTVDQGRCIRCNACREVAPGALGIADTQLVPLLA